MRKALSIMTVVAMSTAAGRIAITMAKEWNTIAGTGGAFFVGLVAGGIYWLLNRDQPPSSTGSEETDPTR